MARRWYQNMNVKKQPSEQQTLHEIQLVTSLDEMGSEHFTREWPVCGECLGRFSSRIRHVSTM
eukprot:1199000-Pyramimonas_sp.AAC.1